VHRFSYRGCSIHITQLQQVSGAWQGEAIITTGIHSNKTLDHMVQIDIGDCSKQDALVRAVAQCERWVEEHQY
jgi:hypothetical protein